jgi:hypothetical protein
MLAQNPTTPSRFTCHPSLKRRGEKIIPSCPRRGACAAGGVVGACPSTVSAQQGAGRSSRARPNAALMCIVSAAIRSPALIIVKGRGHAAEGAAVLHTDRLSLTRIDAMLRLRLPLRSSNGSALPQQTHARNRQENFWHQGANGPEPGPQASRPVSCAMPRTI